VPLGEAGGDDRAGDVLDDRARGADEPRELRVAAAVGRLDAEVVLEVGDADELLPAAGAQALLDGDRVVADGREVHHEAAGNVTRHVCMYSPGTSVSPGGGRELHAPLGGDGER
jgi:hypothetical protein